LAISYKIDHIKFSDIDNDFYKSFTQSKPFVKLIDKNDITWNQFITNSLDFKYRSIFSETKDCSPVKKDNKFKYFYEDSLKNIIKHYKKYYTYIGNNKIDNENGINVYQTDHNSIDFTGLISVLDLNLYSDYWFLLHDTCEVGKNFYKKINSFNYESDTISMSNCKYGSSMNMGAYKMEYLYSIKEKIFQFKNKNYSEESVKNLKRVQMFNENVFLINTDYYFNDKMWIDGGLQNIYNTDVLRQIETYPDIELMKYKSNCYGPMAPVELRI
jgi:hypothetical protein